MIDLMQRLKTARNAGVPLVLITTPDPAALVERIRGAFNGNAPAIVQWDCVRAMLGVNRQGADLINEIVPPPEPGGFAPPPGATLTDAIGLILSRAPDKTILVVHNIQRFTDQAETVQVISNSRDPFKASGKMLILLAPAARLPIEISNDVMTLDDPLPTGPDAARRGRVRGANAQVLSRRRVATPGARSRGRAPTSRGNTMKLPPLARCPRCLGRGYRPEKRRPSKRNTNAQGFYARVCPRCQGTGSDRALNAEHLERDR